MTEAQPIGGYLADGQDLEIDYIFYLMTYMGISFCWYCSSSN